MDNIKKNNPIICPVCSYLALRHIRPRNLYWYCQHCRQEVPWCQRK